MRRITAIFIFLAAASISAKAQGVFYAGIAQTVASIPGSAQGVSNVFVPIPNATVYVCTGYYSGSACTASSANLASIYSCQSLYNCSITQPLLGDPYGNFQFWVSAGTYYYTAIGLVGGSQVSGSSTISAPIPYAQGAGGDLGGYFPTPSVVRVNRGVIPTSASVIGTNSSSQLVADATTGSGSVVLATSPALTTPNLGTPSAVTLTNATGLPLGTGVTGTLPIANGGTGASTASAALTNLGAAPLASPSFTGTVTAPALIYTTMTSNGTAGLSGCSLSSPVGGASAGSFKSGTTGTCTVTITPGITAPFGFRCSATDLTNAADIITQTAYSTTTCTISGTTASSDVITWQAVAF